MTTYSAPSAAYRAKSACSCGGSGVVSFDSLLFPPYSLYIVPIKAARIPHLSKISRMRYAVVDLPSVPTTVITLSRFDGSP